MEKYGEEYLLQGPNCQLNYKLNFFLVCWCSRYIHRSSINSGFFPCVGSPKPVPNIVDVNLFEDFELEMSVGGRNVRRKALFMKAFKCYCSIYDVCVLFCYDGLPLVA